MRARGGIELRAERLDLAAGLRDEPPPIFIRGRLAGAVLAEQGVRLATLEVERDAVERGHAREPAANPCIWGSGGGGGAAHRARLAFGGKTHRLPPLAVPGRSAEGQNPQNPRNLFDFRLVTFQPARAPLVSADIVAQRATPWMRGIFFCYPHLRLPPSDSPTHGGLVNRAWRHCLRCLENRYEVATARTETSDLRSRIGERRLARLRAREGRAGLVRRRLGPGS